MAYEVTKLVHGRPYRYSVRSERDPETGRFRNRWTYLGRADAGRAAAPRAPRPNARQALLDALERLLDRTDVDAVTAGAIAIEAGLAHGTFYRYFRSKVDALRAASERLRNAKPVEPLLRSVPADRAEARAVLREWGDALLRAPARHRGIVRAWSDLATRDPVFAAERRERWRGHVQRLTAYFDVLVERGHATLTDTEGTARALLAMLDGFFREAIVGGETLDDAQIGAALDLMERGVFGSL